jgi:hypothetical protein
MNNNVSGFLEFPPPPLSNQICGGTSDIRGATDYDLRGHSDRLRSWPSQIPSAGDAREKGGEACIRTSTNPPQPGMSVSGWAATSVRGVSASARHASPIRAALRGGAMGTTVVYGADETLPMQSKFPVRNDAGMTTVKTMICNEIPILYLHLPTLLGVHPSRFFWRASFWLGCRHCYINTV